MNGNEPLRRSPRLRDKNNAKNGSQLTGDKHYIFTHDFQQNENATTNNTDYSKSKQSATISRCRCKLKAVRHSPNVFIIDNFLTDNEIDHLLQIVHKNEKKFEVSYTQATATDQVIYKYIYILYIWSYQYVHFIIS